MPLPRDQTLPSIPHTMHNVTLEGPFNFQRCKFALANDTPLEELQLLVSGAFGIDMTNLVIAGVQDDSSGLVYSIGALLREPSNFTSVYRILLPPGKVSMQTASEGKPNGGNDRGAQKLKIVYLL